MKEDSILKNKKIKITSIAAVVLVILILLSTFLSLYFFLWKDDNKKTTTQLNSIITETNLGWVDDNEDLTILNSVESLNPKANDVSLKVKSKDKNSAIIVSPEVNYVGDVDVVFQQKTDINDLVENPIIDGNKIPEEYTLEEIIEIIKSQNNSLNPLDLIIENFNPGEKIQFIVTTSTKGYKGKATFFITEILLSNVIKNTDLGLIKDMNVETIKNEILNKNPDSKAMLNKINKDILIDNLNNVEKNKWIARVSIDHVAFSKVPVCVSFSLPNKLDSIITNTYLGYLADKETETILSAIKSTNSISDEIFKDLDLKIEFLKNKNSDSGFKIRVTSKNTVSYAGEVIITFNVKKDISEIIKTLDLGLIVNPDPETIINVIKSKNTIPEDLEIKIIDIKDTTAKVTTTSEKYQGHVIVNYVLNVLIQLDSEKVDIYVDQEKEINVNNFNLLTNLKVTGDEFASGELIGGKILIKGLKNGKATLIVSASNAMETKTIEVNISNKIEIEVDKKYLELLAGETQTIIVSNWDKLINPKIIKEGNIEFVNNDGNISITANETAGNGNAQITISADNASKEQNISIVIKGKIEIITDKDSGELYVGKSLTVNITNFDALTNPKVTATPAITATNVAGVVTITAGATAGEGTITISADNAVASKVIKITVKALVVIQTDKESDELYIGKNSTINITNFANLINPAVVVSGAVTATNDAGVITISAGATAGEGTITISADNAVMSKVIKITVKALIVIQTDKESDEIYVGKNSAINITNFADLINPAVVVSGAVTATNDAGVITISAGATAGEGTVTISADNAVASKVIKITVKALVVIQTDKESEELYVGKSSTINITNFVDLTNPVVTAAGAVTATNDAGVITIIAGDNVGEGTVTISADNAVASKVIKITVKALVVIQTDKESDDIYVGESSTINITNFADLTNVEVTTAGAVTATNVAGVITISAGVAAGEGTVTISADNAVASKVIKITVKALVVIQTDKESDEIYVGESSTINITNFADLTNVEVTTAGSITAKNVAGVITITAGDNVGEGTVTISADNAVASKVIKITVKALVVIQTDKESDDIYVGESSTINITNFADLTNVEVTTAGSITAKNVAGVITITAGDNVGEGTVTISADNAVASKVIKITVKALVVIQTDKESDDIYVGESSTINITNFADLTNVEVTTAGSITAKNVAGVITITAGDNVGEGTVTISADNAVESKVITIKVAENSDSEWIDPKTGEIKSGTVIPEDVTKVTKIGYDENGLAHRMPTSIIEVPDFISSKITSTKNLFRNAKTFDQDLSGWDVSNVTDMDLMFWNTKSFNGDISGWDVSNVTTMEKLFKSSRFNQDISGWDVSNVTNMSYMFDVNVSFNQDISGWDVSNVTNMDYMFYHAKTFDQDLSGWDVSNVTSFNSFAPECPIDGTSKMPKFK
ncbi:hypothetical protein STIUS_v1c02640 [Spiroplasma sp. TIUS-1]|uniref:BspA family leucine-rich repeat surface protein n=1 Tax=Spiroplasma sp. TIUS-1 TaxID=216963 RepID=UPI001397554D|nr:BspA family leucine-rich repeat surface protein [Spiroplasma sp. TIUS-1]QHX35818.1 hypothetical protein STIUS_v1c02640 [Spiroplasma sp. TIUS-1]